VCPEVQKLKPGSHSTLAETRMFWFTALGTGVTQNKRLLNHVVVVPDLRVGPVHVVEKLGSQKCS